VSNIVQECRIVGMARDLAYSFTFLRSVVCLSVVCRSPSCKPFDGFRCHLAGTGTLVGYMTHC